MIRWRRTSWVSWRCTMAGECPVDRDSVLVLTIRWRRRYSDAVALFNEALRIAKPVQGSPLAWSTTHLNLGHALRKLQ